VKEWWLLIACLGLVLTGILSIFIVWRLRHEKQPLGKVFQPIDMASREQALREQAAAQERERIYSDLHDDLGAKLLGLVHRAPTPEYADAARAILQDLRDVVTRSRGTPGMLEDVLADLRGEAAQRLLAADIALRWEEPDDLPELELDHSRSLHLHRIVREAISNVIRHAHAHALRVRVRVAREELQLELTDDGAGVNAGAMESGAGMRGMRGRAAELEGDIRWTRGTAGGTKILLAVPLSSKGEVA
jgi:signal transduction histidine kinase